MIKPQQFPKSLSLLCLAILFAGGCATPLKSTYQLPAATLPSAWNTPVGAVDSQMQDRWWQRFGDASLNRLVDEVLASNNDLAAATILVRRAWLQADQANSDRLPSVSAQGNAGISRGLGNSDLGETKNFSLGTAVSYELDLWGKLGDRYDAARWQAQATEEDRAATALSLIATTTSAYWQLAYLNGRITSSEQSIAYARKAYELVQVQKAAGAVDNADILEAQRNLASQEAGHTTLLQQRQETRNGLAILFNGPPRTLLTQEPQDLAEVRLPGVDAGLPANLLSRRPDLRAAEARLRSTLATTDATKVSYYPSLNLTGNLGSASTALQQLLNNPIASLGAQLALPFIQWRDMQRNVKISESEYEEAIVRFRQSLYSAMMDVENSLSARMQYQAQAQQLERALESARGVEELNLIRYKAGGIPLKFWLDAQENRRQAEIALAQNRLDQIINHITLSKALGGDSQKKGGSENGLPLLPRELQE
ncbi:MAG: efflux transporter outer membrane subunit [Desulfoprunum sp.]|nr:efflux transporter outer membrane subunit [Desulfoprunum sp.]